MAIVQISRITQRKGLQQDLPQLAGAEFGWSVDTRQLWIGNGTLEEGAPVIGNTEILTEFSDILALTTAYTYKGEAAGYIVQTGPTPGDPVSQSLQSWMDQWATVKDFGAVGDGVTDDTEAINRALYQIYCREVNPQIRRSIFFPAGVYKVTSTIIIPPYATLIGEGPDNTVISLDTVDDSTLTQYVARTGDSLQQIGAQIGTNGAIPPYSINIQQMGFTSVYADADIFLVEDADEVTFTEVDFHGPLTTLNLTTDSDNTIGVAFASTPALPVNQVKFYNCRFAGTTYGINTDARVQSVSVETSTFSTLYQGVVLGVGSTLGSGPTGFSISQCEFNNIYAEGIVFDNVELNATAQNIFYDVGNHFGGTTQPYTAIIDFRNANNISVGDMFERSAIYATTFPRIQLNNLASIAFTGAEQLAMGTYVRQTGQLATLADNQVLPATVFSVSTSTTKAFAIDYTIIRDTAYRTGTLVVTADSGATDMTYSDDYTENKSTGVTLTVTQTSTTINIKYNSTSNGFTSQFTYSIRYLA